MNPPPAHSSARPARGLASALGALAVTAGAALALSSALARALPEPPKRPFDDLPLRQLRRAQPDLLFVGNSMLRSRIDGPLLNRLIAPERAAFLIENGAGSALWYLQLKNLVIASGAAPRRVVFFFRDQRLTQPRFNTRGRFLRTIEPNAHPREPHLERVLAGEGGALRSLARRVGAEVAPIGGVRSALERGVDTAGFALARAFAGPRSDAARRFELNELFAWQNLRRGPAPEPEEGVSRFEATLPSSFLPEMVRLAQEHEIELFFVHVQKRPRGGGASHGAAQQAYLDDLRDWLEANGAGFRDLTGAGWVPESWYARTDHIDRAHRTDYTRLFREHVPEAFE